MSIVRQIETAARAAEFRRRMTATMGVLADEARADLWLCTTGPIRFMGAWIETAREALDRRHRIRLLMEGSGK